MQTGFKIFFQQSSVCISHHYRCETNKCSTQFRNKNWNMTLEDRDVKPVLMILCLPNTG